jgi:hypothetical protein
VIIKRHEAALYLDPNQDGTGWERPEESRESAKELLADLVNSYGSRAGNFTPGVLRRIANDSLDEALQPWVERPQLPQLKLPER